MQIKSTVPAHLTSSVAALSMIIGHGLQTEQQLAKAQGAVMTIGAMKLESPTEPLVTKTTGFLTSFADELKASKEHKPELVTTLVGDLVDASNLFVRHNTDGAATKAGVHRGSEPRVQS